MATRIITKNGSGAPLASDLQQGELAVDLTNKRLYTEDSLGAVQEIGTNPTSITTGTITASGEITANGGIALGDNDKATFGASDDLQIYHDGSNSYVVDEGTGYLVISTAGPAIRLNSNTAEVMLETVPNGAVTAYYDNAPKLATTSTGVNVTGVATTDGIHASKFGDIFTFDRTDTAVAGKLAYVDASTSMDLGTTTSHQFRLLYGGSPKLATTATGIDVTGTVTADESINVESAAGYASLELGGASGAYIDFKAPFSNDYDYRIVYYGSAGRVDSIIGSANNLQTIDGFKAYANGGTNGNAGLVGLGSQYGITLTTNLSGGEAEGNIVSGKIAFNTFDGTTQTERMRIDSSGNVGIGTSSPSANSKLHVAGGKIKLVGSAGGGAGGGYLSGETASELHIQSEDYTGASYADIVFDAGNGSGSYIERMRIDSSGNLLVGKTSAAYGTAGSILYPTGDAAFTRSGQTVGYFNRLTSDGEIVNLSKDGTTVGSIGTIAGRTVVGSGDTALGFGGDIDTIYPATTATQYGRDNAISLGDSGTRFKDLYLSGGVYLGGTGAANHLDDYESGTFTPTIIGDSTAGAGTYTKQLGNYRKVGDLVYVQIRLIWTAHTGTGNMRVSGLPFTQLSTAGTEASAAIGASTITKTSGYQLLGAGNPNTTQIVLYQNSLTGGTIADVTLDTAADLIVSMVYSV